MQKLAAKNKSLTDKTLIKTVSVFIGHELYCLSGEWTWDMHTNSVYCSEVISFPTQFEGTKGIIHPDDKNQVKEGLNYLQSSGEIDLEFRIINTYGEVKTISGTGISIIENEIEHFPWQEQLEQLDYQNKLEAAINHSELLTTLNNYRDKINIVGGCYINFQTLETWYSDNVYRIFGLYPQSLNNHFYTFSNFIHPEDKGLVIEAFERAYKHKLPIHLDFRIIAADLKVKNVRVNTYWSRNKLGQEYLFGLIKDETEQVSIKDQFENLEEELLFEKQLLEIDEDEINIGHWNINLITRKAFFSESFFRIFGAKESDEPVGLNYFINFIHPDDKPLVAKSFENILEKQIPSEVEFRIHRFDGKVKFIKLKSKLISAHKEATIAGIVRDVTLMKSSESKLKLYREQSLINELMQKKQEEFNRSGSWIWNLETDHMIWTDGIYGLLGYKPRSIELDSKTFLNFIVIDDRKLFQENIKLLKAEGKEAFFSFHLNSNGNIKFINASFKLIQHGDSKLFYAIFSDQSKNEELKNEVYKTSFISNKIIQNIKEAVIVTDSENNIRLWNDQSEKIFNKRNDEAVFKNLFVLCPFLKINEILSGIRSVLDGENIHLSKLYLSGITQNVNWQMIPLAKVGSKEINVLHLIQNLNLEITQDGFLLENS